MGLGTQATLDTLAVATGGLLMDRAHLFHGLRALLCHSREEFDNFASLFDAYWAGGDPIREKPATAFSPKNWQKLKALYLGGDGKQVGDVPASETIGASILESLLKVDLALVPEEQLGELEDLAKRLSRAMSRRLSRRFKQAARDERLDLRATIRRSICRGGDPIELCKRGRRRRKTRLVFFLDCSGSMDRYSHFFLRFLYVLRGFYPALDAFLFNTRLTRISGDLARPSIEKALGSIGDGVRGWSGGTRIGECLHEFVSVHGRDMLSRRHVVLILSDGLDRGQPEELANQLAAIRRRARRLIWLNPLAGNAKFRPETRGMLAALPFVDHLVPAHNLESLLALEHLL